MMHKPSPTSINRAKKQKNPRELPPEKIEQLKELAKTDLNQTEIANMLDVDNTTVCRKLKEFGIDRDRVDRYKKIRAEKWLDVESMVLNSVNESDIKKASLLQKFTAAGIAATKYQEITGKAFMGFHGNLILNFIQTANKRVGTNSLKQIESEPNIIDVTPLSNSGDNDTVPTSGDNTISD